MTNCLIPLLIFLLFATIWILPIILGVKAARKRNRSPHWMWFGVHPITGWGAFIIISILPSLNVCNQCGSKAPGNAKFCPRCSTPIEFTSTEPTMLPEQKFPRFSQQLFYILIGTLVPIIPITIFMAVSMMYTQLAHYYWPSFILMSILFVVHLVYAAIGLKRLGYSPWLSLTGLACGIVPFILYCALPYKVQAANPPLNSDPA